MVRTPIYSCPNCRGYFLVITDRKIYCMNCRLTFNRAIVDKITPENVLSEQEVEGVVKVLTTMFNNEKQK